LGSPDEAQRLLGIRLAGALDLFWGGHAREAMLWVEQGLAAMPRNTPTAIQAGFYSMAGSVAWCHRDSDLASERHEKALAAYRAVGDQANEAWTLNNLAVQEYVRGHYEGAIELAEEAARLARRMGDNLRLAPILGNLGCYYAYQDDLDRAESVTSEALALYRLNEDSVYPPLLILSFIALRREQLEQASAYAAEVLDAARQAGIVEFQALAWMTHGHIRRQGRRYTEAIAAYRESLTILRNRTDQENQLETLAGLAVSLAEQDSKTMGVALLSTVDAQRELSGIPSLRHEQEVVEATLGGLRGELDEATFAAAWARGREMTLEQAIALALEPA
jgi:tetratricopeptide (TPR) repeat protein